MNTFFLFCTMTNKCTIIAQIVTLLVHVSTLLCHPQGAFSKYLAKLHKYIYICMCECVCVCVCVYVCVSVETKIVKIDIFLLYVYVQHPCWCVTSTYERSRSHTARCVTIVYCLVTNLGPACGPLSGFRLAALRCYKGKPHADLFNWQYLIRHRQRARTHITAVLFCLFCLFWPDSPQWTRASSFTRFLDHTQRRITVGGTPLDE
jgi:hypothetical protein